MEFAAIPSGRPPRIVIVGAGMAGIAAAYRLQSSASSRFSLTILEASDRIGGRICSREFGGERVELGATWIHGIDGSPIFEVASRIGAMDGADQPWEGQDGLLRDELFRTEGGKEMDDSIVDRVTDFFNDLLHEIKEEQSFCSLPDQSVGEFLRSRFQSFLADQQRAAQTADRPWGDVELRQAEAIFRNKEHLERLITAADSLSDLDMAGYQEYKEFNGEHRTIAKGYSTVVRELSRVLPDGAIQFKKKVKRIRWNQEATSSLYPVTIFCEDGSMEQADHAILTVSLGVLKQAAKVTVSEKKEGGVVNAANDALIGGGFFDPPLPEWKLDPIANLGFGVVNKVFAQIEPANGTVHKPLRMIFKPENDEYEQETLAAAAAAGGCSPLLRKSYLISPINKKSHVLVTWITGREALQSESQTEDDLVKGVTGTLESFRFPHGVCRAILSSKWGTDPLFLGSYSYVAKGSSCDDIDLLAQPLHSCQNDPVSASGAGSENRLLQLLFAGEATHRRYYSTVHGAYLTGVREADRLLQHYALI